MSVTVNGNIAGGGVVGTVSTTSGGTGLTGYTAGDILYASATDTLSKLAKGSDGEVLTLASGIPDWAASGGSGDVTGPASSTDNAIVRFDLTTGKLIQDSGITIADGASGTLAGTNSGDVTLNASVADILGLTGQELTADDPAADRLVFWDDSAGKLAHLTAGTGLTITDTTITASGGGITLGTPQASTSGSTITFSSIPAGTKKITVMFNGISVNGSNAAPITIQLGDSGGLETTGYTGDLTYLSTGVSHLTLSGLTGFPLDTNAGAAGIYFGSFVFDLLDSSTNTWMGNGQSATSSDSRTITGVKALSATLDRIAFVAPGATTFDAGTVNIAYQG